MNSIDGWRSWSDFYASDVVYVSWIYMLGVGVLCYATVTYVLFGCSRFSKWRTKPTQTNKDKELKQQPVRKMESHIQKIVNTGDVNNVSTKSSCSLGSPRLDVVALGMQCARSPSVDVFQRTKSLPVTAVVSNVKTTVVDSRQSNATFDLPVSSTQSSTEVIAAREYAVIDPIPLEFPHFPASEAFLSMSPVLGNTSGKSTPMAPDMLDVMPSGTMFTKLSAYLGSTLRRGM